MKPQKNIVLKYSEYTTALTKNLKHSFCLHCRIDEGDKSVYVCNENFLVKLTLAEYNVLVRPITQREAGNFVLDANGETTATEPMDMAKMLADAAAEAVHALTPTPFLLKPLDKDSTVHIATYYSESGDFVTGCNPEYDAMVSARLPRKSKMAISPMVIYRGEEPLAMILPIAFDRRRAAAVRFYYINNLE